MNIFTSFYKLWVRVKQIGGFHTQVLSAIRNCVSYNMHVHISVCKSKAKRSDLTVWQKRPQALQQNMEIQSRAQKVVV